jgi:hypothetical protein
VFTNPVLSQLDLPHSQQQIKPYLPLIESFVSGNGFEFVIARPGENTSFCFSRNDLAVHTDIFNMSLRRKSCDPCFKARRKCDLEYPVCKRCDKNNKNCHYVYPPILNVVTTRDNGPMAGKFVSKWSSVAGNHTQSSLGHEMPRYLGHVDILQLNKQESPSIERSLGHLGELEPLSAVQGWAFLSEQIRDYPLVFAIQGQTIFINHNIYADSYPRQLRAAFGLCAGCALLNDQNRSQLFRAVDAEILESLTPALTSTLLEDLVILQTTVLYQIIRLFYGDLEQRIVAERQEYLVRLCSLKLLQRAEKELQNALLTWKDWVLAESIRRTVFISFKLYTVYSHFKNGSCNEYEALGHLPVTAKPSSWTSQETFLKHPDHDKTMTYHEFTSTWAMAPWTTLEPFEKMVLMAWKGSEQFEIMSSQRAIE